MKVPQLSPWIGDEEYAALKSCFTNNWITEGPLAKEFEEKLLKLIGSKYGVFAPNGTLALYLGLRALGIGPGDEVLVPDFTFIASATSVEMTGAIPVFIDVNRDNFQIELGRADKLITKKTKAIMPVHIYGTMADMKSVMAFAKKHKLQVIEDAAEAIGVIKNGIHAGSLGDIGCFSFFADKTITTAEGGFVVTNNPKLYDNLLYLRNQGRLNRGSFIHPKIGYNFRMTDLQMAVGLVQLKKLTKIKSRKTEILNRYRKLLTTDNQITFFKEDPEADFVPFRVGILHPRAQELMTYLKDHDIEPRSFFYPLHSQPAFEYLKSTRPKHHLYTDDNFPNSVYGFEHGVCLPAFPGLTDGQIDYVCGVILDFDQGSRLFYKYYDLMFSNKDYTKETNLVFELSRKFGHKSPKKILEIGSGTGNHTQNLAKHQSEILALDTDEQMVKLAKQKLAPLKNVSVQLGRVEDLNGENYDLALAMFNVITYIPDLEKLVSFFKAVSQRLSTGGIFVFDCWNGVAALKDPPKVKVSHVKNGRETVKFSVTPTMDLFHQVVTLTYDIQAGNGNGTLQHDSFSFNQYLWTPNEIERALGEAGLKVLICSKLGQIDKPATSEDWKILYTVKKSN